MNLPLLILSLLFGIGGLVTFILGRRLVGQIGVMATLLQVMGGLLVLAAIVGMIL